MFLHVEYMYICRIGENCLQNRMSLKHKMLAKFFFGGGACSWGAYAYIPPIRNGCSEKSHHACAHRKIAPPPRKIAPPEKRTTGKSHHHLEWLFRKPHHRKSAPPESMAVRKSAPPEKRTTGKAHHWKSAQPEKCTTGKAHCRKLYNMAGRKMAPPVVRFSAVVPFSDQP